MNLKCTITGNVYLATGKSIQNPPKDKHLQVVRKYDVQFSSIPTYLLACNLEETDEELTQVPYMPEHLLNDSEKDISLRGKKFQLPNGLTYLGNGMFKNSPIGKYIEVTGENDNNRRFFFEKDLKEI